LKRKLAVLGACLAFLALLAGRIPAAQATDPESDTFVVTYTACTSGGTCNADGIVQTGEPVTTNIHTSLDSPGGSFYDAVQTVISGVTQSGTVPAGTIVGTGSFTIHVQTPEPPTCSSSSASIGPSYSIYAAQDAGNMAVYPSLGYAKGLTGAESWATIQAGGWIQDFDDDNNNNKPDSTEGGSGVSTLAMTVRDIAPADGIPDGAQREPLYLPLLDAIVGTTHTTRSFGDAVIAAGAAETPVDFVSYANTPSAGLTTQLAVISEGGGIGLLPSDPSGSSIQTCVPFTSDILVNGFAGGNVVQTATGNPDWKFELSTAPDWDGDGVANYQDNCDTVYNPAQTDTDADGIGDACDPSPATPAAADADGDGFNNWVDSCPTIKSIVDSDSDGISNGCDPAPSIVGDGHGYGSPAGGTGFTDHDILREVSNTLPLASGSLGAASTTSFTDSNDNHIADSLETALGCADPVGSGIAPCDSDGDGTPDATDANALDANTNGGRLTKCGTDCAYITTGGTVPPGGDNMVGDGCNDTDEATLGFTGPISQWMFYNVPVPALFSAANPKTTFRTAGTLSAGMAQAVFGYFKKGAKLGTLEYDQDLNENNVMDGVEYDRSVISGHTDAGPADGTISAGDAQKAFAQFKAGLKCASGNGYRLNDHTIP
jgi:hypothetical protein